MLMDLIPQRIALPIAIVIVSVLVLLIYVLLRSRPLRYMQASILTKNEMEFYGRLRRALPELLVLPQMSMAAVIRPNETGKRWGSAFARIAAKRIDFTICRADLSVVCVIELDDRTHNKDKDAARDAMLTSAGIATIRYESRQKPAEPKIRTDVFALC